MTMTGLGFRFLLCFFLVCTPIQTAASGRASDLLLPEKPTEGHSAIIIVAAVLVMVGAIATVFPAVLVFLVRSLGFTAQGIIAGSHAAFIMSLYSGRVTIGSICAICQSIGALGFASFASFATLAFLWPWIFLVLVISILIYGAAMHWHSIASFFANVGKSMANFFKNLGKSIDSFFTNIGKSIAGFFSSLGKSIAGFFPDLGKSIDSFFTSLGKSIAGFFPKLGKSIASFFVNLGKSITTPFVYLFNSIAVFFANLCKAIASPFISVAGFFTKIWNSIANLFNFSFF